MTDLADHLYRRFGPLFLDLLVFLGERYQDEELRLAALEALGDRDIPSIEEFKSIIEGRSEE